MKEYFGASSGVYVQTKGKRFLLMPAIERYLPKASAVGARLLDVGCGSGDFCTLAEPKGYRYVGFDVSADMVARARESHPSGECVVGDARTMSTTFQDPFDALIVSMLLPALGERADMQSVLLQCRGLMRPDSTLLVAVTHPSFDHYMQNFLFDRTDVRTTFKGYYASGQRFEIDQKMHNEIFTFEDYHWTLTDYVEAITKADLTIAAIDECPPDERSLTPTDHPWAQNRHNFPTYMLFVLRKR